MRIESAAIPEPESPKVPSTDPFQTCRSLLELERRLGPDGCSRVADPERQGKENSKKERHLSDSNTRGQRPTARLQVAGDPVNHSGKVTSSNEFREFYKYVFGPYIDVYDESLLENILCI